MKADAERLRCFDQVSSSMLDASAKKEILVMDRAEVGQTKKGLFGLSLENLPFFRNTAKDKAADVKEVDLVLKAVQPFGYQMYRLEMEDGAVWATTEAASGFIARPGAAVHIRRGAVGGYFLTVGKGQTVRARRVG